MYKTHYVYCVIKKWILLMHIVAQTHFKHFKFRCEFLWYNSIPMKHVSLSYTRCLIITQ